MKIGMYKIQITGNNKNKDEGFYSIMTSGESANCLEDEIFFVNDRVVMKLKQDKIKFKIIKDKTQSKKEVKDKDGNNK